MMLVAPGLFGWMDRPDPRPSEGEVVVGARFAGLCGTDLHIAEGSHPRARVPLALGHEFVGIPEAGRWAGVPVLVDPLLPCADCPACDAGRTNACARLRLIGIDRDGALAGRVPVDEARLHPLPPGMDPVVGPLAEPLAVAIHALERVGAIGERVVVVVGAGPVGLLLAHVARRAGAHTFLAERVAARRALASRLGFALLDAADPVEDLQARTDGRLAAVAVDAAAGTSVAAMLPHLVHPGGVITIVGAYGAPVPLDLQAVMFRELSIVGRRTYLPADIDAALAMLAADQTPLRALISDVVAPEGVQAALERMARGEVMKVIVGCPG